MTVNLGHNGQRGSIAIDPGYLAYVVNRIALLEERRDAISVEQAAALGEISGIRWPNGWRGRDGRRLPDPIARFLEKLTMDGDSNCWEWSGSVSNSGYGLFCFDSEYKLAHRFAVDVTRGLKGSPLVVDHLCRNKICVNPSHLEEVSQSANVLRGDGPQIASRRIASVTHCKHGHPLSGPNVYLNPKGYRSCRQCGTKRKLAWQRLNRRRA